MVLPFPFRTLSSAPCPKQLVTKRFETNEKRVIIRLDEMNLPGFDPSIDGALAGVSTCRRFGDGYEVDHFAAHLAAEGP